MSSFWDVLRQLHILFCFQGSNATSPTASRRRSYNTRCSDMYIGDYSHFGWEKGSKGSLWKTSILGGGFNDLLFVSLHWEMIHNLCFSDGLKHHIICPWPFLLLFLVAFRNFAELLRSTWFCCFCIRHLPLNHLKFVKLESKMSVVDGRCCRVIPHGRGTHLTEACRDSHNWQLALGHSAAWNKAQGECCFSASQNSSLQKFCWKC